jgi:hypothetical protein
MAQTENSEKHQQLGIILGMLGQMALDLFFERK